MADGLKKYMLMHKNIPVADIELDTVSGAVFSVGPAWEAAHVPVGIPVKSGTVDRKAFNEWWRGRSIPASRMGIREALMELKISDTCLLLEKSLGLSLSDQYWIRPADSGLLWEKVNFFQNPFSEDVGNILFGKGEVSEAVSLMSPDNTSDGWLKKKWKIIEGKRCLIKGGSGAAWQEPYNEVLASRILGRLGISHVSYSLITEEDYPYSLCEGFITEDTELISAWHLLQTSKKPNHVSLYRHFLDCCNTFGIRGAEDAVNGMLVLDFIIANEDRHLNNFGAVRRADTLEFLGMAPIYDSGTSLWFDKPLPMIHAKANVICKPFKNSHTEQIKLVTDFSWLDFSALKGIDEEFREIIGDSLFIDGTRCSALCRALSGRIEMLEEIVRKGKSRIFVDSTKNDVAENIAYSGSLKHRK